MKAPIALAKICAMIKNHRDTKKIYKLSNYSIQFKFNIILCQLRWKGLFPRIKKSYLG